jgi:hypothetical protein
MRPGRGAIALLALLAAGSGGCTYSVHQYQVSDMRTDSTAARSVRNISAEGIENAVMFSGDTSFVNRAYEQLLAACPHGEIVGIHARHSTSHSFLSYENKLVLHARCVE